MSNKCSGTTGRGSPCGGYGVRFSGGQHWCEAHDPEMIAKREAEAHAEAARRAAEISARIPELKAQAGKLEDEIKAARQQLSKLGGAAKAEANLVALLNRAHDSLVAGEDDTDRLMLAVNLAREMRLALPVYEAVGQREKDLRRMLTDVCA
jgi:Tfp pilus assembly protein FimV